MKAIIGITPARNKGYNSYQLQKDYVDSIFNVGAIPLILPYTDKPTNEIISTYINKVDALLLSGGIDPDPLIWGEEAVPGMGRIDPLRDEFELKLIKKARKSSLPQLGICRGCQLINVALGGSIIQDFAAEEKEYLKHRQDAPRWYPTHTIEIKYNTILNRIFAPQKNIRVNSLHHQGIKELAPGLKVSATAKDGVIEAFEDESGKIMGVQWHPERMKKESGMYKLFKELVEATEGS